MHLSSFAKKLSAFVAFNAASFSAFKYSQSSAPSVNINVNNDTRPIRLKTGVSIQHKDLGRIMHKLSILKYDGDIPNGNKLLEALHKKSADPAYKLSQDMVNIFNEYELLDIEGNVETSVRHVALSAINTPAFFELKNPTTDSTYKADYMVELKSGAKVPHSTVWRVMDYVTDGEAPVYRDYLDKNSHSFLKLWLKCKTGLNYPTDSHTSEVATAMSLVDNNNRLNKDSCEVYLSAFSPSTGFNKPNKNGRGPGWVIL